MLGQVQQENKRGGWEEKQEEIDLISDFVSQTDICEFVNFWITVGVSSLAAAA